MLHHHRLPASTAPTWASNRSHTKASRQENVKWFPMSSSEFCCWHHVVTIVTDNVRVMLLFQLLLRQGDIMFEFKSALNPGNSTFSAFSERHGDAVKDVSFTVEDCAALIEVNFDCWFSDSVTDSLVIQLLTQWFNCWCFSGSTTDSVIKLMML